MADQSRSHSNIWRGTFERSHPEGPLRALSLPGELLPSGSRRHGPHIRTLTEPKQLKVQGEVDIKVVKVRLNSESLFNNMAIVSCFLRTFVSQIVGLHPNNHFGQIDQIFVVRVPGSNGYR